MQYQKILKGIIGAVSIISPESFSFAGKIFSANGQMFYPSPGTATVAPLVRLLSDIIYQQCYCRNFNGSYYESIPVTEDSRAFQTALSQANGTTERWEPGWVIEQGLPTGQYAACKNGKYKFIFPGEFISAEYQSGLPREGTKVTVHCVKESASLQPGFYFVFSNEANDQQSLFTIIRFYWNIKSTGAARLIEMLTNSLNKYSVPFSFKCLNQPALYTRTDAAVLYINRPYYTITAQILSTVYPQVKDHLNDEVPLFAKKIQPGLSLAEDPGTGESFGMSRCRMIAQGIYDAYQSGVGSMEESIYKVQQVFNAAGLQLDMPYLNAGSIDVYEFTD